MHVKIENSLKNKYDKFVNMIQDLIFPFSI